MKIALTIPISLAYTALFYIQSATTNEGDDHLLEPHLSYSYVYEESSDDSYSTWSEWSDCTGNCSGGISRQNRECLFGLCRGPLVQHRTCNIEPCPQGTRDIRERQCEIFNDVQYDHQVYSWIPVSPLPVADECALVCKAQGHNLTRKLSPTVLDGTPCRSGSRDMCLNGKCIPIGCNYEFNSTSTLDRCLVCGGDNTTCKLRTGRQQSQLDNVGLEEVLLLPKGIFSVRLTLKGSTSFPGVKTEDGLEGINQKQTVVPGRYTVGGTEVQFGRLQTSDRLSIAIPNKLKQNLWVTILRTTALNVGDVPDKIIYHYIAPVNNVWRQSEWSRCTRSCAGGVQKRRPRCYDQVTDEIVNKEDCKWRRPTDDIRECNMDACPLAWKISDWSDCTQTCGGGRERRIASCVRESSTGVHFVHQSFCQDRPVLHRSCNTQQCPQWHIITDWNECSVTCAAGEKSRTVQCLDYSGSEVHGCLLNRKPIARTQCHTRLPCLEGPIEDPFANYEAPPLVRDYLESSASYSFSAWGPCSVTCGAGVRSRNVSCVIFVSHTKTLVERPEVECRFMNKPNVTEDCISSPCQIITNIIPEIIEVTTFNTTTRTESEDEIDHKERSKLQKSSNDVDDNYDVSSLSHLFPSESPYSVDSDYIRGKSEVKFSISNFDDYSNSQYQERYIWQQNGFTECSLSCAGGMQEAIVECIDFVENNVVSDGHCYSNDPFPKRQSRCNEQPCPAEWRVLRFSECSHTCGSGHQTPLEVFCMQVSNASNERITTLSDDECEGISRPGSVSCSNIDCPPHWVMNMWSPCTEECGRGSQSRLVSCTQLLGNGEEVNRDSRQCAGMPPPEIESCNEMDCPPSWLTGLFSECSVTCGQGQRFRPVKCTQVLANGDPIILDSSACPRENAPHAEESCSVGVCFEPKILSNNSIFEQEETRGRIYLTVGQRATMLTKTTLIVRCPTEGMVKPNVQWLKGSAIIPHNKTMKVRAISGGSLKFAQLSTDHSGVYTCQAGSLSENFYLTVVSRVRVPYDDGDYLWIPSDWSQCTVTCGGGLQHRDVECQHANRRGISGITEQKWCTKGGVPRPDVARSCNQQLCTPHWVAGEWSQCLSICRSFGMGTKTRVIGCRNSSGNYIDDSECQSVEGLIKPVNISDCKTERCIPLWHVTRWKPCTATCGMGMRKRVIKCLYRETRKPAQPMHCEMHSEEPHVLEQCNIQDCPVALDTFESDSA